MARFPDMNWAVDDVGEDFTYFKQQMELVFEDSNITDKAKQANKIRLHVGVEGLKRINASGLSAEDQKDPDKLWEVFDQQLHININFRIHRLELKHFRQRRDETLDTFINRCRQKALLCDFTDNDMADRIMELVIDSTPFDEFRKELLEKPKAYTLKQLREDGRKYEAMQEGNKRLHSNMGDAHIDSIQRRQHKDNYSTSSGCKNCGLEHPPKKCPAYRDECRSCHKKGHWAKMCRSKGQRGRSPARRYSRGYSRNRRSSSRRRGRSFSRRRTETQVDEFQAEEPTPEPQSIEFDVNIKITIPRADISA